MRNLTIAAVFMLLATAALAAPRTYAIAGDGKNQAGFRIDDTLETIDGFTSKVSGTIVADPDDVAGSSVDLTVDMSSLDTGIAIRDREMREKYLETGKFRTATFKSVSVSGPKSVTPNTPVEVNVSGDFTVHGVTRRIVVPVRVVLIPASDQPRSQGAGNLVHATSKFKIRMSDYGITVPEKLLLSVANELEVKFDLFASAK